MPSKCPNCNRETGYPKGAWCDECADAIEREALEEMGLGEANDFDTDIGNH